MAKAELTINSLVDMVERGDLRLPDISTPRSGNYGCLAVGIPLGHINVIDTGYFCPR